MTTRWGDTSPTLAISKKFEIDWSLCLRYCDFLVHGRGGLDLPTMVELPQEVRAEIKLVADDTREMFEVAEFRAARGELVFMGAQGWQHHA